MGNEDKDKKGVITKMTAEDMLTSFYNKFLEQYVSAIIDIDIYSHMGPDEDAYTKTAGQDNRGQPMLYKVKAKEAIEERKKMAKSAKGVLDAIARVRNSKELKEYG